MLIGLRMSPVSHAIVLPQLPGRSGAACRPGGDCERWSLCKDYNTSACLSLENINYNNKYRERDERERYEIERERETRDRDRQ